MGVSSAPATSDPIAGMDTPGHSRHAVARLVSLYVTHAVDALVPMSADGVEARLGGGSPRSHPHGRQTSGLHRKHLEGQHAAEPARLRRLIALANTMGAPDRQHEIAQLRNEAESMLWRWLYVLPTRRQVIFSTLRQFPEDVFWSMYGPTGGGAGRLSYMQAHRPKIESLVISGRADAVALLALYGQFLRSYGDANEHYFEAVRAVPAAISVWSRRPGAEHVAPFVFARLRQLGLDTAVSKGRCAEFNAIDLEAWAREAPPEWPQPLKLEDWRRRRLRGWVGRVAEPTDDECQWVGERLAPVRQADPPGEQMPERWLRDSWPIDQFEKLQLHAHFGECMSRWLGPYWAPRLRGHARLREMNEQVPCVRAL